MIATRCIEYKHKQLIKYECSLSRRDQRLKSAEMLAVIKVLTERGKLARGHLDVGTFTARYVLGLRSWVVGIEEGGRIIGVDNNPVCANFAKGRVREMAGEEPRIHIIEQDFLKLKSQGIGRFDLITVMLGTLSHFGYDKNDRHDDSLQHALENMGSLLSEDGILILSNWSEQACAKGDMLEMYDDQEREALASWTASSAELDDRLRAVGLSILGEIAVEDRLNLLVYGYRDRNSHHAQSYSRL